MEAPNGLIGQETLLWQLNNAIDTDRVAHAYLISGEAGSGKRALARAFTEALFCRRRDKVPDTHADDCRLVREGNHPDVIVVEPSGTSVRIDQIRQLRDRFALRSYTGWWKVGIIVDAELMTAAAANSLLKLLEEPSGRAVLMLITASPSLLLSTIISRCQMIRLQRVSRTTIAAHLRDDYGVDLEEALIIAGLADGSLGKAIEIWHREDFLWRQRVLAVVTAQEAQGLAALRLAANLDNEPEAIEFALHVLATWFRDLALVAAGCGEELVVHRDHLPELQARSSSYNVWAYQKAIMEIKETLRAIGDNANRRLALDALFYQIVAFASFPKASEV